MQNLQQGKIYKNSFFAFLTGAVLIGILLGVVQFCCTDSSFLTGLGIAQENFIAARKGMNFGQLLLNSLGGTTVFLFLAWLFGFSAVGQVPEIILLLVRGMGLGLTLSQLYSAYGKSGMLYSAGLILPSAIVSCVALIIGAREAIGFSNIYLKITLSGRQENGLLGAARLYCTKFLVLEAMLAVSAGIDCFCTIMLINRQF